MIRRRGNHEPHIRHKRDLSAKWLQRDNINVDLVEEIDFYQRDNHTSDIHC